MELSLELIKVNSKRWLFKENFNYISQSWSRSSALFKPIIASKDDIFPSFNSFIHFLQQKRKKKRMRLMNAEKEARKKDFSLTIQTTLFWPLTMSLSSRVWTVKGALSAVPWGTDPAVINIEKGFRGLINLIHILFNLQADCLKHTCIWCCWRQEGHQGWWQLYTTAANWYNCSLCWNMSGSFLQNESEIIKLSEQK